MNWSNIWLHPKTTIAGLLIGIVTVPPILQAVDWKHLSAAVVIGLAGALATALLGLFSQDPNTAQKTKTDLASIPGNRIGVLMLISVLLMGTLPVTGCSATGVAQDIVNWTPTIVSTANTVGAVVASLDPPDALLVGAGVAGFDAAANLLAGQAQAYLKNPSLPLLQQLQVQVLAFQQQVTNSLLQAGRIVNPQSQQKVLAALQGLATGITAVIALISTIKGNTVSPASVTAVHMAQLDRLMNQDLSAHIVAVHYGVSDAAGRAMYRQTIARMEVFGL
jgi:hypothetical protein